MHAGFVKPRANGRNMVECYTLRPFPLPVACCFVLLGVIAQSLKPVKLLAVCKRTQQLPTMLRFVASCVRLHEALDRTFEAMMYRQYM